MARIMRAFSSLSASWAGALSAAVFWPLAALDWPGPSAERANDANLGSLLFRSFSFCIMLRISSTVGGSPGPELGLALRAGLGRDGWAGAAATDSAAGFAGALANLRAKVERLAARRSNMVGLRFILMSRVALSNSDFLGSREDCELLGLYGTT